MKKSEYDNKPLVIEAIGNGSYFYRWDISEVTKKDELTNTTYKKYECYEVVVWSKDYSVIVEAVITEMYGDGVEEKLINDYNAAQHSLDNEGAVTAYLDFLKNRIAIKDEIKTALDIKDETLVDAIDKKILAIKQYDESEEVNSFILNGTSMWIKLNTRISVMNSTKIKQEHGIETTTLRYEGLAYTLPCDTIISLLQQIEIYADACFNVTAEHLTEVAKLKTIKEVNSYDITAGYPEKPTFNL